MFRGDGALDDGEEDGEDAEDFLTCSLSELRDTLDESDIPFRVDLHVWDDIPQRFQEIIESDFAILSEPP